MHGGRAKILRKAVVLAVAGARKEFLAMPAKQRDKDVEKAMAPEVYPRMVRRVYRHTKAWWDRTPAPVKHRITMAGDKGFAGLVFLVQRDVRKTFGLKGESA